jgi:hypothetical protein
MTLSPLNARRLQNFRANRRGRWSLWLFAVLFVASLFAELIANDKPIVVSFAGDVYFPVFEVVPETTFGGFLETEAEYKDPEVRELIEEQGWIVWPLVPFSYDSINFELSVPAPAPPSAVNWLGTDDQGRDVLARLIYGFRISVLFGLTLTLISSVIGVIAGAVQGYFGGWTDLLFQRFIEIWSGLPQLYLLIILASVVEPNFWWLLGRRGAGRVPARAQLRLRTRRTRPGCGQRHHHVPPPAAQRDGRDAHLHAVHPQRVDHHADRFPRLRPAARIAFARGAAQPGQEQPAGTVARPDRLCGAGGDAEPADLHRRGGA